MHICHAAQFNFSPRLVNRNHIGSVASRCNAGDTLEIRADSWAHSSFKTAGAKRKVNLSQKTWLRHLEATKSWVVTQR